MNPRVFSLDEANQLIPKLRELTLKIQHKKELMQKKHDQLLILDLLAGDKINEHGSQDNKEYLSKSAELESLILSFEEDVSVINRCGCYLRDIDRCSIDFFSIRKNELVYLNWQMGEEEIRYYHDVDTHYSDRKTFGEK